MDTTAIIGYSSLVLSGLSTIYIAVNHKRLRSVCCNRLCITSIDIENTSPAVPPPKVNVDVV
jgi:hypothetical protein